jgi:ubiquitin C-terminal hydrolase
MNPPRENLCYINCLLQCLASCISLDSPGGDDFTWLLYYLTQTHIHVKQDKIPLEMSKLASQIITSNNLFQRQLILQCSSIHVVNWSRHTTKVYNII